MTIASDNKFPKILVTEGAAPASPSAGDFKLYVDSSDHLFKMKNSSGTVTTFGQGVADQGTATYFDFTTGAAPASPSAGKVRLYSKTGDHLYQKVSGGTETALDAAGGGATIQRPSLTPGTLDATYGDDFAAASLDAKWSRRADSGTFNASDIITQARDGSHLRISANDLSRFQVYESCPGSGDFEFLAGGFKLNFHPRTTDYLFGIGILNSAGTGEAIVLHAADVYLMSVTTWGFGAQQGAVTNMSGWNSSVFGGEWWLRITKVGTTYTGYVSMNGISWLSTAGSTNAITPAYFAIGTFFSSGPLHGYIDVDWVHKV